MGLLSNAAIIAVIAIIIAAGLFILFHKVVSSTLTAQSAEGLVFNDIRTQNPSANVSLIGLANSTASPPKASNSWLITLSVVYNGTRPCPTVQIEQFDYPAFGLHSTTSTTYSYFESGVCHVPSQQGNQSLPITLPIKSSIAMATAYASGNRSITSYVSRYGYNYTSVNATFNQTNAWLVRYRGIGATNSLYAILSQSGQVSQTYNVSS